MKNIHTAILVVAALCLSAGAQQTKFRSGVFLHHSTGATIWGPNGSSTSVPDEMARYNSERNLTGADSVNLTEVGWPVEPWNNEWERWHRIFDNQDTIDADIRPFVDAEKIIVIKSCFPSSELAGNGSAEDTLDPTVKTVANYKWHWRNFIGVMAKQPKTFFVVWTNAPLVAGVTNDEQAGFSDSFCRWAKDTLAKGLDPVFGTFPGNVYVFDFFHKLAGTDGKLPAQYATGSDDSHPNAAATELVAPQFVDEVFNASIAYESVIIGVKHPASQPSVFTLGQNYPNPFNPATAISYELSANSYVVLKVYDVLGREVATLVNGRQRAGSYTVKFDAGRLSSGVYIYKLVAEDNTGRGFVSTKKLVLMK
jgi:Secretion system C-terminal sorting domain